MANEFRKAVATFEGRPRRVAQKWVGEIIEEMTPPGEGSEVQNRWKDQ